MVVNLWASRFFPQNYFRAILIVPTDYADPKDFLMKHTKLAPGQGLLRLGLPDAISMAYSIPHIYLLQDKSFNKEILRHPVNHGLLMTGNLKTAAIKNFMWSRGIQNPPSQVQ